MWQNLKIDQNTLWPPFTLTGSTGIQKREDLLEMLRASSCLGTHTHTDSNTTQQ